jgi:hypothetical protein
MTDRPPPRAASWLLAHLLPGPRFEPLLGDLDEQFAEGRSRLWYWRQALGAMAIHVAGVIRTHGPSFAGAIVAGCALTWLLEWCCTLAFEPFYLNLAAVKLHPWSAEALSRLAGMVGNTVFWCCLCLASAWLVTRVHRAHQRAVLVVFVITQIGQRLPDIVPLAFAAAKDQSQTIALATQIILAGQHAAFTLVAGLWALQPRRIAGGPVWIRVMGLLWLAQVLLTALIFSARRVGELSYARPEGYLTLYAITIVGGAYVAYLIWRLSPVSGDGGTLNRRDAAPCAD